MIAIPGISEIARRTGLSTPTTMAVDAVRARGRQGQSAPAYTGPRTPTPAEQKAMRESDITAGQNRFKEMMEKDPRVQDIINRRSDMSQGLNAQEMNAAREQMAMGLQGQQQQMMRSLMAQQARSGVRGGMAGAQMANANARAMAERANAEQKMLLDNYALRRQGLGDYQDIVMRQKFGELGQGLGEAGLGVADRTGAIQAEIGKQMAMQAGKEPKRGILGEIFSGLI